MRIAVFTRCLTDGGTERVVARLTELWSQGGHEIFLFTAQQPRANEFAHLCRVRKSAPDGVWSPNAVRKLHKEFNFSIVVFNGGWNDAQFDPLVRTLHVSGVKVVTILHHAFNNWAFAQCNERDFDKDDVLPLIDVLVCVDKMQALWWSRRHPCVVSIQNPVAVLPRAQNPDAGSIVWIGRPKDFGKRVQLALKTFERIAIRRPDASLIVVGAITEKHKSRLLCGLSAVARERVVFTEYVSDVSKYLCKASICLQTTLWEVAVPQTILEAQVMSVPTVAFDIPVLRGVGGVLLAETIDAAVELCDQLLSDASFRARVGQKGHAWLESHVRTDVISKQWQDLFAALHANQIDEFASENRNSYQRPEIWEKVLDEVQRGESEFMLNYYPELCQWRRLKGLLRRICTCFGLKGVFNDR